MSDTQQEDLNPEGQLPPGNEEGSDDAAGTAEGTAVPVGGLPDVAPGGDDAAKAADTSGTDAKAPNEAGQGDTAEESREEAAATLVDQRIVRRFVDGGPDNESGWAQIQFAEIKKNDRLQLLVLDAAGQQYDPVVYQGQTEFVAESDANNGQVAARTPIFDIVNILDRADEVGSYVVQGLPLTPVNEITRRDLPATPSVDPSLATPVDAGKSGAVAQFANQILNPTTLPSGTLTPKTLSHKGTIAASPSVAALREAGKSLLAKTYVENLITYIEVMDPRKVNQLKEAVRQQTTLYNLLTGIVNRLTDDFHPVWGALLATFQEYKDGVLGERYVFRHMDQVPLAPNEVACMQNLLNLIRLTADPKSRALGLKQVDLQRTLQFALTEDGRNRIMAFYNV